MQPMGYLRITRPVNAIVAGLATILGYLVAGHFPGPELLPLILTVILVTAAGNTINDYYDAVIDKVNRPDRPLPRGEVSMNGAYVIACVLFALGILATIAANRLCTAIALFNSLLLIGYAARLKRMPLAGNITVAYLSGSIFLFGGSLAGIPGLTANLPLAIITMLSMLAREILKAVEDLRGDTVGGAHTLPMVTGVRSSVYIAIAATVAACGLALSPLVQGWGVIYLALMVPTILFLLVAVLRARHCSSPECVRLSGATRLLKLGMFLALAVLIAAALYPS
ncbi:MAG: geranylgeranylglycerol-phosphate geranylgeranyltransferase [Methanomicrobiales archaeon]|nr:geranylgeranylglycerol-phosphate geranylgeranyltransferase [Methanomicrobiales archaeon]